MGEYGSLPTRQVDSPMAALNDDNSPRVFAVYGLLWIAILVLLCTFYLFAWWPFSVLEFLNKLKAVSPLGGLVPLLVPWAGALGGATISLVGTAKHAGDWETKWNLWHFLRPVLGAISGTVAFIIVVIVLRTAGGLQDEATSVPSTFWADGLFLVIAFIVGFRDRMFLMLIARVADVILATRKE